MHKLKAFAAAAALATTIIGGGASMAGADTVRPGDTLAGRYRDSWGYVCVVNVAEGRIPNCNTLVTGQYIRGQVAAGERHAIDIWMANVRRQPVVAPSSPSPGYQPPPQTTAGGLAQVRGIVVHATIGARLEAMLAAAARDGLTLTGSGHRSPTRQIQLRRANCGTSNYAIYQMPPGQCSPATARPGTSLHEKGLAIDFNNCSTRSTRCHQWLARNAAPYGFYNLPSEPWHWSTTGK